MNVLLIKRFQASIPLSILWIVALCYPCLAFSKIIYNNVSLTFPQADTLSSYTLRLPFRQAGRLIVVEASAENKTGNFILDTGSEKLVLNSVHYSGGINRKGITTAGVTGSIQNLGHKSIRDFQSAGFTFQKLQADIVDLSHIENKKHIEVLGLIGYEVVKDFELIIDYQLRQITLTRTNKTGERLDSFAILEPIIDSLDVSMQAHFVVLKGWVDNTPVSFGLDSGAELNLINRKVKRKVLDHFKISKRVMLNGAGQQQIEVLAGKLYRFRSGNQRCSGMRTLLTNMTDMNKSFHTNMDGLLGFEFLCMRRTIINYKKKKLYFLEWHRP